jgi:hypothetical protein
MALLNCQSHICPLPSGLGLILSRKKCKTYPFFIGILNSKEALTVLCHSLAKRPTAGSERAGNTFKHACNITPQL